MGVEMTQTASADALEKRKVGRKIETPLDRPIRGVARRLGGKKADELERFLKFAVVGVIGAIVDFGTLNLLINTVLPPLGADGKPIGIYLPIGNGFVFENVGIATTIAFVAAVLSNFTWNRIWTYPDSRSRSLRRQLFQFGIVSLVGWVGRLIWVKLAYFQLGMAFVAVTQSGAGADTTAKIGANIAQLVAVGVVMIWNFFANRYWTYNDVVTRPNSH
jgi:putative flippase GtrA